MHIRWAGSGKPPRSKATPVTRASTRVASYQGAPAPPSLGKTVLVVDDEKDIRDSLALFLETSWVGAQAILAEDGLDGLRLLDECRIDCILTDYVMPEMNGVELLRRVFLRYPEMPAIILSGLPDEALRARAEFAPREVPVLAKPIDLPQLVRLLNHTLSA
jgi:CheY-like chemotaxis protein